MFSVFVHGVRIEVRAHRSLQRNNLELTKMQLHRIETTLQVLPAHHLSPLARIEVRQRAGAGGSANSMPDGSIGPTHFVVLDIDTFVSPWNNTDNGLLYTLLHEMGHVVDWSHRAFTYIRQHDRAGYDAICRRIHHGRTQNQQEKFADSYADIHFPGASGAQRWPESLDVLRNCPIWTESESARMRR
ncbi:MAG: hypothetical protein ABJN34_00785 [Litoreibacter sp.]|uniref:hypothetical protein n=1 Tax=Litoreibacter sp. TaxID=1969459 RepID=UPI00329A3650